MYNMLCILCVSLIFAIDYLFVFPRWSSTPHSSHAKFVLDLYGCFNIKTLSFQYGNFLYEDNTDMNYRNSHYKGYTVWRPSYLYNGNPIPVVTASLYWNGSHFSICKVCISGSLILYHKLRHPDTMALDIELFVWSSLNCNGSKTDGGVQNTGGYLREEPWKSTWNLDVWCVIT